MQELQELGSALMNLKCIRNLIYTLHWMICAERRTHFLRCDLGGPSLSLFVCHES